jgi:predicted enzyme related to lactoylglutathione lyase
MTGEPSYIELGVRDDRAAKAFYGRLFGWEPAGPGQIDTATLSIGIHGGDDAAYFEVFFAVDDLESSMELVGALGGRILGHINDSPGFGRWVECADDQGVRFGLRQSG